MKKRIGWGSIILIIILLIAVILLIVSRPHITIPERKELKAAFTYSWEKDYDPLSGQFASVPWGAGVEEVKKILGLQGADPETYQFEERDGDERLEDQAGKRFGNLILKHVKMKEWKDVRTIYFGFSRPTDYQEMNPDEKISEYRLKSVGWFFPDEYNQYFYDPDLIDKGPSVQESTEEWYLTKGSEREMKAWNKMMAKKCKGKADADGNPIRYEYSEEKSVVFKTQLPDGKKITVSIAQFPEYMYIDVKE